MPTDPVQTVLDYHQRTKHHLDRYARSLGYMDWDNQPDPFRVYEGAESLPLPLLEGRSELPYQGLYETGPRAPAVLGLASIAAFLELSLGLSAWKRYGASEWALRMNPSSGNLHPTECHLLLPAAAGVPACLAHYNPFSHQLEVRAALEAETAATLESLHGFALILSSIFWREAWKYGERAYRYTQHDIGHALGALRFSAALQGWGLSLRPEIAGASLDRLLGFEPARQPPGETEKADCLCWVACGVDPAPMQALMHWLASLPSRPLGDRPNRLSAAHVDWPVIEAVAHGCESPGFAARPPPPLAGPPARTASPQRAEAVIRRRRSAQAYVAENSHMELEDFMQTLGATLPRGAAPFDLLPLPTRLHLVLFVHRVDGLAPGLYCWVRDPADLGALRDSFTQAFAWRQVDPDRPLYLLQAGDCRSLARTISCHQDIAGDSAFSLGMLARFESILKEAPWHYPTLYWEAGLIGQVLYLEAEAKGLRGTGIGCYFDDLMHQVLGLRDRRWQDLYHFTIGRPREDSRLQTLSPYHHLAQLRASG